MAMLEPKLAILDETDSGLDIDALRIVSNVNKPKAIKNAIIVITHYQRLLDHIVLILYTFTMENRENRR
jgi:Fe-S cluster assembly ATP-binding protein